MKDWYEPASNAPSGVIVAVPSSSGGIGARIVPLFIAAHGAPLASSGLPIGISAIVFYPLFDAGKFTVTAVSPRPETTVPEVIAHLN